MAWKERRNTLLEKTKIQRAQSKNIHRTRRLIAEIKRDSSSRARVLLSTGEWLHTSSKHFYIFHALGDQNMVKMLLESTEENFVKILSLLGDMHNPWASKANIFVTQDLPAVEKRDGSAAFHEYAFSIPSRLEIFLNAQTGGEAAKDIGHHISHLILREYVDTQIRSGAVIPAWLDEGLAEYASRFEEHQKFCADALGKKTWVPLVDIVRVNVLPEKTASAQSFKAESAMLISFLMDEYGAKEFREIIDLLLKSGVTYAYASGRDLLPNQAGESFEFLLKNSNGEKDFKSLETFEAAWKKSILS